MLKKIKHYQLIILDWIKQIPIKSVFFLCIALVIIYAFFWYFLSLKTGWQVIKLVDNLREHGLNISLDDYENKGFPSEFSVKLENISFVNKSKTFGWKTEEAVFHPSFSNDYPHIIDFLSDQFFSYRREANAKPHKIAIRSLMMKAIIKSKNNVPHNIKLITNNVLVQFGHKEHSFQFEKSDLNLQTSSILLEDRLETSIQAKILLTQIEPPPLWKAILEDNFESLSGVFYLRNPSSLKNFVEFEKYIERGYDPPEIVVDNVSLHHRLSRMVLNGLVYFDDKMQLNGNLTLTISDYQKLLSFLTKKGVLTPEIATNLRFMLSFLLSTKNLQKTDGTVDIPLKIKENTVFQGKIKLFEL